MKILYVCIAILLLSSCRIVTGQEQPLSSDSRFSEITVADNIELIYSPGNEVAYTVEASDDNTRSKLKMTVKGDVLNCKADDMHNGHITVRLTAPDIKSFIAFNNASIVSTGTIDIAMFDLYAYNNGTIRFSHPVNSLQTSVSTYDNACISLDSLTTGNLTASSFNSSTISLAGSCADATYSTYNNANIDAANFQSISSIANSPAR